MEIPKPSVAVSPKSFVTPVLIMELCIFILKWDNILVIVMGFTNVSRKNLSTVAI